MSVDRKEIERLVYSAGDDLKDGFYVDCIESLTEALKLFNGEAGDNTASAIWRLEDIVKGEGRP